MRCTCTAVPRCICTEEDGRGELVFTASLSRVMPDGQERPIMTSRYVPRNDDDEERVRRVRTGGRNRRWWLLMTLVLVATPVVIWEVDAAQKLIKVRSTNGAFHYKDLGDMYPGAGTATIKIGLAGGEMCDALKKFNGLAAKAGGITKWIAVSTQHDLIELERSMAFFNVTAEEEERIERDVTIIGTIFNFFEGLLNRAKLSDLELRLDKQQDANKWEMTEMEGIRSVVNKILIANNKSEEIISNEINALSKRLLKESVQRILLEEYALVNSNATSLTRILRSATSHRADPAIADLVDMKMVWEKMRKDLKEKGMALPGEDWQHIFQMPLDIYVRDRNITIAIHFPTRPVNSRKMRVHSWIPTPLYTNGQLLQVNSELRVFGTDESGTVAVVNDVADCVQYGDTRFCRGPLIHERSGFFTSCVCAIWRMDIPEIRTLCELTITPLRDSVTPVGSRNFQLVVEKKMNLLIECHDGRSETKEVGSGMHMATVVPSCFIQNDRFRTEEGAGVDVQTTRVTAIEEELDLLNPPDVDNVTISRIQERLRGVKQPTPAASFNDRIMDDLAARGSAVTKFYIIIGLLVLGLVVAAAGAAFLLWKSGRLETLVRTNQEECRRHQPQLQQPEEQIQMVQGAAEEAEARRLSLEQQARMRDNILAQLEETLRAAELRMEQMQPEEREEMLGRLDKTRELVQIKVKQRFPDISHEVVVPKAQQEFIAPDQVEVMPDSSESQSVI